MGVRCVGVTRNVWRRSSKQTLQRLDSSAAVIAHSRAALRLRSPWSAALQGQRKVGVQRKPEQSICTVVPLLQVALKRVALLACTWPQLKPVQAPL